MSFARYMSDGDSFSHCLRENLERLELELLEAHFETRQPWNSSNQLSRDRLSQCGVDVSSFDQRRQSRKLLDNFHERSSLQDFPDSDELHNASLLLKSPDTLSPRRPYRSLCKRPMQVRSALDTKLPDKMQIIEEKQNDDLIISYPSEKAGLTWSLPDHDESDEGETLKKPSILIKRVGGSVKFEGSPEDDDLLCQRPSIKAQESVQSGVLLLNRKSSLVSHTNSGVSHTNSGFAHRASERKASQASGASMDHVASEHDIVELTLRPSWMYVEHTSRKSKKGRKTKFVKVLSESMSKHKHHRHRPSALISKLEGASTYSCVIHPFSKVWLNWEIFGFLLLLYDLVLVPMQAFEMPQNFVLTGMKWLTMVYWTITLFLTFNVSFQRQSDSTFVVDHRTIICHYFKGWFIFDFFLVSSDWAGVVIESLIDTNSSMQNARMARMARLGRLFRFIRLLRVMRIGEMLQRVRSLINSEYVSICFLLACNVLTILVLAHLAACAWFGIGDLGSVNGIRSWLVPLQLDDADVGDQYLQSLGWSLSTLLGTTVSRAFPQSRGEHSCALVILVVGTIAVSLVFSSTTAAMTRLQQLRSEEREAAFKLKKFLRQNNISGSLEARVTRYVDIAKSVHSNRIPSDKVVLLDLLSGPLRLELQLELHAPHLTQHAFFELYHVTSPGAMSELCLTAVGFIYLCRYDSLFQTFSQANHMYFLVGGVMAYRRAKGAKKTPQTVKVDKNYYFSEAALWTLWVHRGGMKAIIESQVLALDAASFCEITESHHDVFLQACEYAVEYLEEVNQRMCENRYIWDISSELMYPDEYVTHAPSSKPGGAHARSSLFEPSHLHLLKEAEQVSAELINLQDDSDSDSEDERLLKSALQRGPSMFQRATCFQRASSLNNGEPVMSAGRPRVSRFAA